VEVLIIILGFIFALIGIAGCVLPAIPGPPLSYLALIFLSYAKNWKPFSQTFLIVTAILAIILVVLDYILPAIGAKKYGASKLGIVFSVIGMIIGFIFLPPFGVFIGAFSGAVVGEILAGKRGESALKVGWGVFLSNMFGIGLKLAYTSFIFVIYALKMF
jgi:hypothetical protein